MHNNFDRFTALFPNMISKLQAGEENQGVEQLRFGDGEVSNIKSKTSYSDCLRCAKY